MFEKYIGPFSEKNGCFGAMDDLGRVLPNDNETSDVRKDRKVGIFYFLWIGEHGTDGPYDISAIVKAHPKAIESEENWYAAGGGPRGNHHFWGKPLFGYYRSSDDWVMRKHLQMLTDAGVDFIVFDTTNGPTYDERMQQIIAIWYEYLEKGVDVPKMSFYTNSASGQTMEHIFKNIYKNKELHDKYPRLEELWFKHDGKPMIIGIEAEASQEIKEFFTFKESVWPNAGRCDNGFPWMEFERALKPESVYGRNGRKEVMNVSVAQHSDTCRFSATAWYGGNDMTRSWHNGANDTAEDAVSYGYNFAKQWEYAIEQDPEMVFVTGWNEWVAQRQPAGIIKDEPIWFVDCATYNCSRDVEPAGEVFGDNYYMQLCSYIRKYKGAPRRVYVGKEKKIDIYGKFSQWEDTEITAVYTDYSNDTADRNAKGFGNLEYKDSTGRNDFTLLKVCRDSENIYFYAETAGKITDASDENWMTLFLKTGKNVKNWYGYQFAVNLEKYGNDGSAQDKLNGAPNKALLSQCRGGWNWEKVCEVDIKVEENKMMIAIPRKELGNKDELIDLQFKWADNYQKNEKGEYDINTFYCHGDAAPYGRMNYVYSEVK